MHALTMQNIETFRKGFEADPSARTLGAVMAKTEISELACIPMNAAKLEGGFTIDLKTRGITAQEKSGRCWMFAAMNILREIAAEKLKLDEFELSENYLAFYDKLEKANNFLEMVIENAEKSVDERISDYIFKGIGDGGYWDMAVDLVKKYGVVPKWIMPETYQSSHTEKFMKLLNNLLRKDAAELRSLIAAGKDPAERKLEMMAEIYKAECIVFGEPVDTFTFEYRDSDGEYHAEYDLTPKAFYEKYIGLSLDDYTAVVHVPTDLTPVGKRYEFHYRGNMAEGSIRCLNLEMEELEELVLKQLRDGEPVWFGCDAGAPGHRQMGIWDPDSFDYEGLLGGVSLEMSKKDRLETHASRATHAMILVGVNLDRNGKPDRWKIENSWGGDVGKNGYFVCSEKYFKEYVYEAIIHKKHLNEAQKALLQTEPVRLEPWAGDLI